MRVSDLAIEQAKAWGADLIVIGTAQPSTHARTHARTHDGRGMNRFFWAVMPSRSHAWRLCRYGW